LSFLFLNFPVLLLSPCLPNFHWVGLIQGHVVVICVWCALFVTSQFDVFSMFRNQRFGEVFDIICKFFYIHSPYFMCHCTEYKLSALQVRLSEKNKVNATTQRFITAKISGCAKKQGSETHSSLHQRIMKCLNSSMLTTAFFCARATISSCFRNW